MNGQNGAIYFILNFAEDLSLLTMSYSMAPLNALVDGLRMKNRCHQKEGVTLTPQYCYKT